jgi:putative transcriptional regulator
VRKKTGLTQNQFASTFGINLGTLRHWERGDRKPHSPALVLLNAANNAPDELLYILAGRKMRPDSKKSESNRVIRTRIAA